MDESESNRILFALFISQLILYIFAVYRTFRGIVAESI